MKSIFKRLAVIMLTVVMLLPFVPQADPYAAELRLGPSKEEATTAYSIQAGDILDLNFYGASGYDSNKDAKSVKWTSSNTDICDVTDSGEVIAYAPGKATVSCTVTVSSTKQTMTGSVNIFVIETEEFEAVLTKYIDGVATYEVEFADEKSAEANKDNVKVYRVRQTPLQRLKLSLNSKVTVEDNRLQIAFSASEGVDYCIEIKGFGSVDRSPKAGAPIDAWIECEPVIVAAAGQKDVLNPTGAVYTPVSQPIVCTVIDDEGVIVAEYNGKDGGAYSALREAKINYINVDNNVNITSKTVRHTKQGSSINIMGKFTCKYQGENIELESNVISVGTIDYVEPMGLDYVYDMHLENVNTDKTKIEYSDVCLFKDTLKVRDDKQIVFVFRTVDMEGNVGYYTGANISSKVARTTKGKEIGTLSGTLFPFVFKLDPELDDHCIVLDEQKGTITAIKDGTENVYLYTRYGAEGENLAGYIEVTVEAEPYLKSFKVSESSVEGYVDGATPYRLKEIQIDFLDQDNNPLPYSKVRGFSTSSGITYGTPDKMLYFKEEPKGTDTSVTLVVNMEKFATYAAKDQSCGIILYFTNSKGNKVSQAITVYPQYIPTEGNENYMAYATSVTVTTQELVDYVLVSDGLLTPAEKAKLRNKLFLPASYEPDPEVVSKNTSKLVVLKTIDGIPTKESEDSPEVYYQVTGNYSGLTYPDGTPITNALDYIYSELEKGNIGNGIYVTIFVDGKDVYSGLPMAPVIKLISDGNAKSDLINSILRNGNALESLLHFGEEMELVGWVVDGDSVTELEPSKFTYDIEFDEIKAIETGKKVENGVVTSAANTDFTSLDADGDIVGYLIPIIGSFGVKQDFNFDGKDEWVNIKDMASVAISFTPDDIILASDNKTIFIRSFTMTESIPYYERGHEGYTRTRVVTVGRSYETPGWDDDDIIHMKTTDFAFGEFVYLFSEF